MPAPAFYRILDMGAKLSSICHANRVLDDDIAVVLVSISEMRFSLMVVTLICYGVIYYNGVDFCGSFQCVPFFLCSGGCDRLVVCLMLNVDCFGCTSVHLVYAGTFSIVSIVAVYSILCQIGYKIWR